MHTALVLATPRDVVETKPTMDGPSKEQRLREQAQDYMKIMTCRLESCKRWRQYVRDNDLRLRPVPRHTCLFQVCSFFDAGHGYRFCKQSGNMHWCTADECTSILDNGSFATCIKTGIQYPLQLAGPVDRDPVDFSARVSIVPLPPKRPGPKPKTRTLAHDTERLSRIVLQVIRMLLDASAKRLQLEDPKSNTSQTPSSMPAMYSINPTLDAAAFSSTNNSSNSCKSLSGSTLGLSSPRDGAPVRKRQRRSETDVDYGREKKKKQKTLAGHQKTATRRMRPRTMEYVTSLSDEAKTRFVQTCLRTWNLICTAPSFEQLQGSYLFENHVLVIACHAKDKGGFDIPGLIHIPFEPDLHRGLVDRGHLSHLGLGGNYTNSVRLFRQFVHELQLNT